MPSLPGATVSPAKAVHTKSGLGVYSETFQTYVKEEYAKLRAQRPSRKNRRVLKLVQDSWDKVGRLPSFSIVNRSYFALIWSA